MFTDAFLLVAETYARAAGIELKTLSSRVFNDGKVLPELHERRRTISMERAETAMLWFSSNWPADLDWPADVQRPVLHVTPASVPAPAADCSTPPCDIASGGNGAVASTAGVRP